MHPISAERHWGHGLHDGMMMMWHHIDQHLHSRHFWVGVGVTLLIMGFITLLVIVALYAPIESAGNFPYGTPYMPYGQ